MSEIVFYDSNPSIRALFARCLSGFGMEVVEVEHIEQTIDALKSCQNPVLFIADMSRQPEFLTQLQRNVPSYLDNPDRCVLTSVQPTALAPFIISPVEDCFFKHIVERPFKKNDFLAFVETLIHPDAEPEIQKGASTALNSGISQITATAPAQAALHASAKNAADVLPPPDHALPANNSSSLPNTHTVNTVRREHRMSRLGRSGGSTRAKIPPSPSVENTSSHHRESSAPRPVMPDVQTASHHRESSAPRPAMPDVQTASHHRESSAPRPAMPDVQTADPSESRIGRRKRPAVSSPSHPVPGSVRTPASRLAATEPHALKAGSHQKSQEQDILDALEASIDHLPDHLPDDDPDEENTLLVSPNHIQSALHPTPAHQSPSILISTQSAVLGAPICEFNDFQLPWLLDILASATLHRKKYTLAFRSADTEHVLFLESARAFWFESIHKGVVESAERFIQTLPDDLDKNALTDLVRQNLPLSHAFKTLHAERQAGTLCEQRIRQGVERIAQLVGQPCALHEGLPDKWAKIVRLRPCKFIPLGPILFDLFRTRADAEIPPPIFASASFVTRNYRTPINAHIALSSDELELLAALRFPKSLESLRATGIKHAADTLCRLFYFGFCDLTD